MLLALDMYSIGIGPSSSHTIGPMKAGFVFAKRLESLKLLDKCASIRVETYGSLALTGKGHGTFIAIMHGLEGKEPHSIDSAIVHTRIEEINEKKELSILGKHPVPFFSEEDISVLKDKTLPQHENGMIFYAYDNSKKLLLTATLFSVGGGFIAEPSSLDSSKLEAVSTGSNNTNEKIVTSLPYEYNSSKELFELCKRHNLSIAELAMANEVSRRSKESVEAYILELIEVMTESIERGIKTKGILPGHIKTKRRASELYDKLISEVISTRTQRLLSMCYALAVNEENACFTRVVTAPTNGSAGTIPAVFMYFKEFFKTATLQKQMDFILTAGAIGVLYKLGASISAAEVGCQGEIGVASSMAAGALAAVRGGSLIQIEKAAEIAMEHSLGMTCDPIGGLVQIPCIERNGIAATRSIDIADLALLEDEPGKVSLDQVIATMLQTGKDMSSKYRETSLAGLAVNHISC